MSTGSAEISERIGYGFQKTFFFVQQDREEPGTVDKHLANVPFEARFAEEEIIATNFSEDPGSDGFVMNSAPLFEVYKAFSAFVCVAYLVISCLFV